MSRLTNTIKVATATAVLGVLGVSGVAGGTDPAAAASTATATTHTLYWLNSDHAGATGNASAARRMQTSVNYLRSINADVAVMVEVEPVQVHDFQALAGSDWGTVVSQVTRTNPNTTMVAYNKAVWRLAKTFNVTTIGWGAERVKTVIPVLVNRATGYILSVMSLHNPADNASSRATDLGIERSTARNVLVQHPNWHFVVAGDFNDDTVISKMTSAGSHLGSALRTSERAMQSWTPIDQAFYTTNVRVGGYLRTSTTATDHKYQYQLAISE